MLRSALIPVTARNLAPAQAMIDFLVTLGSRAGEVAGLLVFLDRLKRESFLRSWTNAILQQ